MCSQYEKRIIRVLRYIHDNPSKDLSLDKLADVAAMSRFHWHRVFHSMTGETCAQAVRRLRLFRAAGWLVHRDWSIVEISERVGYDNEKSFVRAFKEGYGVSPTVFRKIGRLGNEPQLKLKGKFKMFDVKVINAPKRRLAALAHRGPYTGVGICFDKVSEVATSLKLWSDSPEMAGVYLDDPNVVSEEELTSYAGLVICANDSVPEGLEEVILVEGDHAVLRYRGSYEGIGIAYDHLFGKWLPKSRREPADAPCYELYVNSPKDEEPDDLLTDIYLPLAANL